MLKIKVNRWEGNQRIQETVVEEKIITVVLGEQEFRLEEEFGELVITKVYGTGEESPLAIHPKVGNQISIK